jgi:hypothetical protein
MLPSAMSSEFHRRPSVLLVITASAAASSLLRSNAAGPRIALGRTALPTRPSSRSALPARGRTPRGRGPWRGALAFASAQSLQPILNAAMRQSGQVDIELADYLKTSPSLAHWLSRWQAEDAKT